jgi:hypothetical protein
MDNKNTRYELVYKTNNNLWNVCRIMSGMFGCAFSENLEYEKFIVFHKNNNIKPNNNSEKIQLEDIKKIQLNDKNGYFVEQPKNLHLFSQLLDFDYDFLCSKSNFTFNNKDINYHCSLEDNKYIHTYNLTLNPKYHTYNNISLMINYVPKKQLQIFVNKMDMKYKYIGNIINFDMLDNYHIKNNSKIMLKITTDSLNEPLVSIQMFCNKFIWNKSIKFMDNNVINIDDIVQEKTIYITTPKINCAIEL